MCCGWLIDKGALPFLKRKDGGYSRGWREGQGREKGGMGNCDLIRIEKIN